MTIQYFHIEAFKKYLKFIFIERKNVIIIEMTQNCLYQIWEAGISDVTVT